MKIRLSGFVLAVAIGACPLDVGQAAPAAGSDAPRTIQRRAAAPTRIARDSRIAVYNQSRRIDVNNINMFVTNYGTFANDIEGQGNSGLYFPKGTTKTAVYQSGPWFVGKVGNEVRVAIGEYSQEFQPGAMNVATANPDSFAADDFSNENYIVYKVVRYAGSPSDTDHVERDAALVAGDRTIDPIAHHSWSEYVNGAAPYGAPVRTYRFPDPNSPGDSVDVLGPDMKGDQMLWSVYNDADPTVHINRGGHTNPLGIEVQQTTFAFDRQGALGNTVFLEFKVINKGGAQIDSCYINMWSDPDLGGAGDDLVGCDTTLSLGYIYNATNTDQLYADRPPAVGYDFFQGPKVGNTILPLTAFIYYINGTDPTNAVQTFNYMKGLQRDGTPFLDPNNNPTSFYASGDPVAGTGYLDTNPSDRRFMVISGPFSMAPGDTQTIVGAIIIAQGGDRLSSITGMKFFDVKAQKAFDINFQLPPPPPPPKVTFSTDHGSVNLAWDSGPRFNYTPAPGWEFEGFNVYQGASVSGPWKRLKTLDLVNTIKDVRDTVFDVNTGLIVNDTPTAFGGDNGVEYTYSTGVDAIKGGALKDGTRYFFAVTAYSVNLNPPQGLEKVLETSFQPIAVIPQRPASGTDVGAAKVDAATVHQASTAPPPTTDHVVIDVIDPASITGHTYAIAYQAVGPDTTWSLTDRTTGQVLLANQTERSETPSYAPVDGMIVKLRQSQAADPPNDPLNDVYFAPFDNDMPFAAVDWGGTYFGGGLDYAFNFFAGVDPTVSPEVFKTIELRFGPTQKAYRFFRDELANGGAPGGGRAYTYQGFRDVGFQAWNVDDNQQVEVAFLERQITDANNVPTGPQPATQDGTWGPIGDDGSREYLFISMRPYTGTEAPELTVDGAPVGADTLWLYAGWVHSVGTVKAGDKFIFLAGGDRHGTPNDTLVFTTSGPATNLASLQKEKLNTIRVVPNPYYSRSSYELSSFNRIIKFINMPERATVRIYDLAGHLVRTLEKTDQGTSILEWDIQNENRLPIASGIYIYHVDVPNAGTTIGRLVVFMEKERLTNF